MNAHFADLQRQRNLKAIWSRAERGLLSESIKSLKRQIEGNEHTFEKETSRLRRIIEEYELQLRETHNIANAGAEMKADGKVEPPAVAREEDDVVNCNVSVGFVAVNESHHGCANCAELNSQVHDLQCVVVTLKTDHTAEIRRLEAELLRAQQMIRTRSEIIATSPKVAKGDYSPSNTYSNWNSDSNLFTDMTSPSAYSIQDKPPTLAITTDPHNTDPSTAQDNSAGLVQRILHLEALTASNLSVIAKAVPANTNRTQEMVALEQQVTHLTVKTEELAASNNHLQYKILDLEEQCRTLNGINSELDSRLQNRTLALQELEVRNSELISEKNEIQKRYDCMFPTLADLEQRNTELLVSASMLTVTVADLNDKLCAQGDQTEEVESRSRNLLTELDGMKATNLEISHLLELQTSDNGVLRYQIGELTKLCNDTLARCSLLRKEAINQNEILRESKQERSRLQDKLVSLEDNIELLTVQYRESDQARHLLEEKVASYEVSAEQDSSENERARLRLQEKVVGFEGTIERLRVQISESDKAHRGLKEKAASYEVSVEQLSAQCAVLVQEKLALQERLALQATELSERNEQLSVKIDALDENDRRLGQLRQQVQGQTETLENERKEFSLRRSQLETVISDLESRTLVSPTPCTKEPFTQTVEEAATLDGTRRSYETEKSLLAEMVMELEKQNTLNIDKFASETELLSNRNIQLQDEVHSLEDAIKTLQLQRERQTRSDALTEEGEDDLCDEHFVIGDLVEVGGNEVDKVRLVALILSSVFLESFCVDNAA
jgi:hypothetical protein